MYVVQVLYADGTVSVHTGHWELPRSRDSSPQRVNSAKSQPDTPTKEKKGGEVYFHTNFHYFKLFLSQCCTTFV